MTDPKPGGYNWRRLLARGTRCVTEMRGSLANLEPMAKNNALALHYLAQSALSLSELQAVLGEIQEIGDGSTN